MQHERLNGTAGGQPAAVLHEGRADDQTEWRERRDRPVYSVTLWPNRSLTSPARRLIFSLLVAGLAVPLLISVGTPVFWGLLPFAAMAVWMLWYGLRRNDAAGRLVERLTLWRDEMRVERIEPDGRVRRWRADPYWVRLTLHPGGKVESYLTLKGGNREIELGAFLSPWEREALAEEIEAALRRAVTGQGAVGAI